VFKALNEALERLRKEIEPISRIAARTGFYGHRGAIDGLTATLLK